MLKNIFKTYKSFIDLKLANICRFLFSFYISRISLLNFIKLINIKIFGSIFSYIQFISNKLNIQLLNLKRILVYYLNNIIIFYIFIKILILINYEIRLRKFSLFIYFNLNRVIKKYSKKYFIRLLFIESTIKFIIILLLVLSIKLIISIYFINSFYIILEYYENYVYYNYSEGLENKLIFFCLSIDYFILKNNDLLDEDDYLSEDEDEYLSEDEDGELEEYLRRQEGKKYIEEQSRALQQMDDSLEL